MKVDFYDSVEDELLEFAVIISKSNGKWVVCKHKERTTFEIPGGHREVLETIEQTGHRELYEETGAIDYILKPICVYSVTETDNNDRIIAKRYGMLFLADIFSFEKQLYNEIESISLLSAFPDNWTYPLIQPKLIAEAQRRKMI
jgi:ADP-ribose pyrophosphatase